MILNREQVEKLKEIYAERLKYCRSLVFEETINLIETLEHTWEESERKERRLEYYKNHKPMCYSAQENNKWCVYTVAYSDKPKDACKDCHWCEQGYEALGEVAKV